MSRQAAVGSRRGARTSQHARALVLALVAALLVTTGAAPADATSLPPGFVEARVPGELRFPSSMAVAPDGRVFVGDRQGTLRVFKDDVLLPTPVLTVEVSSSGERGLLGITFDPDFASNGHLYVYYTAASPTIHNRVSRFTLDGDVAVPASEVVLLDLDDVISDQHNAGALRFGLDGKLYIATGDNFRSANAQTLDNTHGKILRINRDGTIPEDNPFAASASGRNRAIWALGLRNPFTFDIQPGTGRMFVNDVGHVSFEEVNEGVAGSNYGWPLTEGPTDDPRFRSPVYAYAHGSGPDRGCALTGGAFYNPAAPQFPAEYLGRYFFIDFCSRWIKTFDAATGAVAPFATELTAWNTHHVVVGTDGSLYYLTSADPQGKGGLFKIRYTGSLTPQIGTQPQDQLVVVSETATFSVSAYGDAPLSYQWQVDGEPIPGATDPSYTTPPTELSDDGRVYRCVVTNGSGSATSGAARLGVTANRAPVPAFSAPADGAAYVGGETIAFAGSASDPEDGEVPPSGLTWQVDLHHNDHVHPGVFLADGVASGTFTVPTTGETSTNVFYRFLLTATDSAGRSTTVHRDIRPTLSQLSLRTSPSGLQLALDGLPVTAPYTEPAVVGLSRTLSARAAQAQAGKIYAFTSWSDGGAREHAITTPLAPSVYTAAYLLRASGTVSGSPHPIYQGDGTGRGTSTLTWSTTGTTDVEIRLGSPTGSLFARSGAGTFSQTTGKWVTDGMTFYLQDRTGGLPLTEEWTLATYRARVVPAWGEISLEPNPATVTDGTGLAAVDVRWGTSRSRVEVRVNAPNGSLFSRSGAGTWSATTGKWVRNGTVFYLQDVSDGKPLTSANTIATVTARVRSGQLTATPNPVIVTDGTGLGATTLSWTTAGTSLVEVRVGSPSGSLFSRSGSGSWSATTGTWVRDGLTFYLQDVTGGAPLTPAHTLGTVVVRVHSSEGGYAASSSGTSGPSASSTQVRQVAPTKAAEPRSEASKSAPAITVTTPKAVHAR